jgi:hypothetical protein
MPINYIYCLFYINNNKNEFHIKTTLVLRVKNALRVKVWIFILSSSPSLSHSRRRPSLSTDSTSGLSLSRHLFLSDFLYLTALMFYLYYLMFYLNIFYFIFSICCVELFFYIYFYVLNFVFICLKKKLVMNL